MRRHIPLVLSGLALFIALGGDAAATSVYSSAKKLISGKQIRNGTIAERKLAPSVRTKLNKAGEPGPAGAPGATGATGPAGNPARRASRARRATRARRVDRRRSRRRRAHRHLPEPGPRRRRRHRGQGPLERARRRGHRREPARRRPERLGTRRRGGRELPAGVRQGRDQGRTRRSSSPTSPRRSTQPRASRSAYMCSGGTVYAKRKGTGVADVVFHPTGQTGQFGASIGGLRHVEPVRDRRRLHDEGRQRRQPRRSAARPSPGSSPTAWRSSTTERRRPTRA